MGELAVEEGGHEGTVFGEHSVARGAEGRRAGTTGEGKGRKAGGAFVELKGMLAVHDGEEELGGLLDPGGILERLPVLRLQDVGDAGRKILHHRFVE